MQAERVLVARSIAPRARAWEQRTREARVLHVFARACNLVNQAGELLSLVTAQAGNGPFSIVLEGLEPSFLEAVSASSCVQISRVELCVGSLRVRTSDAQLWDPRPDWEQLYAESGRLIRRLYSFRPWIESHAPLRSLMGPARPVSSAMCGAMERLSRAVAQVDLEEGLGVVGGIAGVGIGLTPAGDDYLLGSMLAAWIIHPAPQARALGAMIGQNEAPLTTTLSAAYLRGAAEGQAGEPWHKLLRTLRDGESHEIAASLENLLSTGHTSGADALHGFLSTIGAVTGLGGSRLSFSV